MPFLRSFFARIGNAGHFESAYAESRVRKVRREKMKTEHKTALTRR